MKFSLAGELNHLTIILSTLKFNHEIFYSHRTLEIKFKFNCYKLKYYPDKRESNEHESILQRLHSGLRHDVRASSGS